MTNTRLIDEDVLRQVLDALGECMSHMEAPTSTQPYVQTALSVKLLRNILSTPREKTNA